MKKIITIIFCLLVSTTMAFAQHLVDFKGVNLDNDLAYFAEQMESKGFKFQKNDTEDKYVIMQGVVYGKTRDVNIYYTPKTLKVWKVIVCLDDEISKEERIKLYNTTKREFKDYIIDEDPTKHTWTLDFGEYGLIAFMCNMVEYYDTVDESVEASNIVTYVDGINRTVWLEEEYGIK